MNFSIISIKTKELIMPGYSLNSDFNVGCLTYLKVLNDLELSWKRKKKKLERGYIVIGKRFTLYNYSQRAAAVRGFSFQSDFLKITNDILIIDNQANENESSAILNLYNQEISTSDISNEISEQITSFISNISKSVKTHSSIGKIDSRLIQINRFLRKNFGKPITLLMLAELIECNPIYLSNTYSKVFRISPMRYLQNIRMTRAMILLRDTNIGIKEIANQVGYISNSQFSDLFKRHYNMTPSEYRINCRIKQLYKEK